MSQGSQLIDVQKNFADVLFGQRYVIKFVDGVMKQLLDLIEIIQKDDLLLKDLKQEQANAEDCVDAFPEDQLEYDLQKLISQRSCYANAQRRPKSTVSSVCQYRLHGP